MFKHFIMLEWKSFIRSASLGTNLIMKIFMALFALYFMAMFSVLGVASFYIIKENFGQDPIVFINKFLIYYLVADLAFRFLFQKMPVMNIIPLMVLPIKRERIVHYSLGKTAISFFNIIHAFFFIPFTVVLILNDFSAIQVILWNLSIMALIFVNNYINILINNKNSVFYPILIIVAGFGIAQYYQFFDVTEYTFVFFNGFYNTYYFFLIPVIMMAAMYYFAFKFFKNHLNLDGGLAKKSEIAKTENLNWLNQFGTLGTFLKNDIRLLKRNKRARSTILPSVMFLFYGLLFFTNAIEAYDNDFMRVFAAIFVSGGFLITFGQFVPSWDSAYYQLMMSQNIQYKDYLDSKWWLMVIATAVSTILASFYLYFGLHIYLLIVVGAIYNIGINSYLVLFGGAFLKTPIDLSSAKQVLGNKQAFNLKVMLISFPKLLLPIGLYALGNYILSPNLGLIFIALAGVSGLAFKGYVFSKIEKIYKTEKYKTILAYKQIT
ncbi:MAG: DUF5687 family protein [Flavobacterium sp.]